VYSGYLNPLPVSKYEYFISFCFNWLFVFSTITPHPRPMRNGQALTLWLDSAVAFRPKKKVGSWVLNSYSANWSVPCFGQLEYTDQKAWFLDSVVKGFWLGSVVVTNWWLSVFMAHTLAANGKPAFFGFGNWVGLLIIFVKNNMTIFLLAFWARKKTEPREAYG